MEGTENIIKGLLVDLLMPILPKIFGKTTSEYLIDIYWLISLNAASVASNLGGIRNSHLTLTMTAEEYLFQMAIHSYLPTTPTIPPKLWETPKSKLLEPKGSNKTKNSSDSASL